jgi:hypothetical protein
VFLYRSGEGIIARGVATGIVEVNDYQGNQNEEHYMNLTRFELLNSSLPAREITAIIRKFRDDFDIQWNQNMNLFTDHFGRKVWQHFTRYCIN